MTQAPTMNGHATAPEVGEQTKKQGRMDVAAAFGNLPGYGKPQPGTLATYKRMRNNPTIAIARMVAQVPIRGSNWSYEVRHGDGLPRIDEAVEFIRTNMKKHRAKLLKHLLTGYDYGFSASEKVFGIEDGRIIIERFKPLSVDITLPLEHKDTGSLLGVKNGDVQLFEDKVVYWAYDAEPGNHWGRSRHENIRETAYTAWQNLYRKQGQYITKVAGVIPMVEYEPGTYQDESGADVDAYEIAQKVIGNLGRGAGVAMPRVFSKFAEDLIRSGVNIRDLQAWSISFLEPSGAHGSDFVAQMKHYESLLLRGWMVPERSVAEGQFGTKAEAGEHADLATAIAEMDNAELAELLNDQVVDQLLTLNFGPEYKGKVVIVPEPLADEDKAFVRNLLSQILVNPMNIDILQSVVDLDAAMDSAGLPKIKDVVSVPESAAPDDTGEIAAALQRTYKQARPDKP